MNNERRKALRDLASQIETKIDELSELMSELENIKSEEQDGFDNLPESFQEGARGEAMQAAIDNLEEATSAIDCDEMRGALSYIEEACA